MATEVRFLQGIQPVQQVVFALEVGQCQGLFGLQARRAGGHPVGRVKKQRLCLYPRLCAACMKQAFADLETASGMSIQSEPAVHAHQRAEGIGVVERQLQADQRPQRMTHDAVTNDPGGIQRPGQLVGHHRQAVGFRQHVGIIARPALVVAHHLVLLLQDGKLR